MRKGFGISLSAAAIAASAAVHALVFVTLSTLRVGPAEPPPEYAEMAVVYDEVPTSQPAPNPNELDLGSQGAKGYATHDLPGPREQLAREAPQDQPSLSLDPVGLSRVLEVPSTPEDTLQYVPAAPSPPPALTAAALTAAQLESVRRPEAMRLQPDQNEPNGLPAALPEPPRPEPPITEVALAPVVTPDPAPPPNPAPPSPPAPAKLPTPPGTGADPAPQSDSESDAFSVLSSAEFRAGRVTVQFGREVKTRRPRVGLAGMVELAARGMAKVVLKVSIDAAGNVTNVDVLRSSGSNDIDQPCRVAMYDWWFEPKKDPAGRPVPDVFQFTISFR